MGLGPCCGTQGNRVFSLSHGISHYSIMDRLGGDSTSVPSPHAWVSFAYHLVSIRSF